MKTKKVIHAFFAIFSMLSFASVASAQKNLNSMSKDEYNSFVKEIYKQHQKDPQAVGETARDIIIGMAGLENRPSSHPIFEIDVNFT